MWAADVMPAVMDDLANREARNNQTQYRLRYLDGPDGDAVSDKLVLSADDISLEVVYLAE